MVLAIAKRYTCHVMCFGTGMQSKNKLSSARQRERYLYLTRLESENRARSRKDRKLLKAVLSQALKRDAI